MTVALWLAVIGALAILGFLVIGTFRRVPRNQARLEVRFPPKTNSQETAG
jgi:hypothetical protein